MGDEEFSAEADLSVIEMELGVGVKLTVGIVILFKIITLIMLLTYYVVIA